MAYLIPPEIPIKETYAFRTSIEKSVSKYHELERQEQKVVSQSPQLFAFRDIDCKKYRQTDKLTACTQREIVFRVIFVFGFRLQRFAFWHCSTQLSGGIRNIWSGFNYTMVHEEHLQWHWLNSFAQYCIYRLHQFCCTITL